MLAALDRLVHRRLPGRLVEVAELAHAAQHVGAALRGERHARDRVLARGRLQDAGEEGGLGGVDLAERLAEVRLGRGREPVGALAEELRVHEQREDLLLRQLVLEREREEDLAQLAPELLLVRDERGAHELLRQRAAALRRLHRRRGDEHGARDALPVDARVWKKRSSSAASTASTTTGGVLPGDRHAPLLQSRAAREQLAVRL